MWLRLRIFLGLMLTLPIGPVSASQESNLPSYRTPLNHPETRRCLVGDDSKFRVLQSGLTDLGQFVMKMSRDGDETVDYIEVYSVQAGQIHPFPYKFKITDYNDETVDHRILDMNEDGRCSDLREINPEPEEEA